MGGKEILFVCVENSARSQMAEGFCKVMAPHIRVRSAGTKPGGAVNPEAVRVMREVGIDIAGHTPKPITQHMLKGATVINMGCIDSDACPALGFDCIADWQIEDPKGKSTEQMRAIRDLIRKKVCEMLDGLDQK